MTHHLFSEPPLTITTNVLESSLFHTAGFVFHSVKYVFHTVVFISHTVGQRIRLVVSKKTPAVKDV